MTGSLESRWHSARPIPLILGLLLLVGCASVPEENLYQALGGSAGIERMVESAVQRSHADPRFDDLFVNSDQGHLQEQLSIQICQIADGPCEYQGLSMAEAHSGMNISKAEFNWFVEHTREAMTESGIPVSAQNRLLARLAPMREEVLSETASPTQPVDEPVDPLGLGE